jgi:hypothetical protein
MQKYLVIRPQQRYPYEHTVEEFATEAEVAKDLQEHGSKDAIVARRMDVRLQLCDWEAPEPEEEEF